MTFKLKTLLITVTLLIIAACTGNQPPAPAKPAAVAKVPEIKATAPEYFLNSSEYKLLLDPGKFNDYPKALEAYWNIVQEVATQQGLNIILEDEPLKLKHKQVTFFDTPDHDLKKAGFLFRQRQKFKKEKPTSEYDYVLKYVQPNLEALSGIDMNVDTSYLDMSEGVEIESDLVYDFTPGGQVKTKYTISNSFDTDKTTSLIFGDIAKIYPILNSLDIPGDLTLQRVGDVTVDQWKIGPGSLDFGDGLVVEMDFTVWLVPTESGVISIPEFSYDHGFSDDVVYGEAALERCFEFMKHVNAHSPDWVVAGRSKSAYLYELK